MDDDTTAAAPQFDNPEAETHMTQGEFLRLVNAVSKAMGNVANDAPFAVVIGACVTILEQCLAECAPEGREAVHQNIVNSLSVAMNKIALREADEHLHAMRKADERAEAANDNDEPEEPAAPGVTLVDGPDTLQ